MRRVSRADFDLTQESKSFANGDESRKERSPTTSFLSKPCLLVPIPFSVKETGSWACFVDVEVWECSETQ
nr:hypothetical protein CFP56_64321 [Quercus suber]